MADLPETPAPVVPEAAWYIDSGGQVRSVPAEQATDADALGWQRASPEQVNEFQLQQKYGDTSGQLKAGAAAAARALTLGLSDQALTKTGLVEPETLRGLEEANPGATGVGTAIGIAAPLLLTAGAAAPAEAAAQVGARGAARVAAELTAPSLIARAGQAVSRGVEAAMPGAEGLVGRIVQRAAATGAGSAVEGAAYGLGQVVTEEALGDPNLTAQSALAEIGAMAAIGGGLGSALGVAHEVVPLAVQKTRDAVGSAYGKLKGEVESWYAGAEGMHGVNPVTAQLVIEHKLEVSALEQAAPGITQTLTTAPPAVAASIIENAGQFGALEREFPGVAKTLSKTRPDTLSLILKSPQEFANLEREFPGTLRQLSAAEPKTAQYLADNWTKIVRDPTERARLAEAVRKSGQEVIDSTDAMFKKAYGEMMKEGAEDLLGVPRAATDLAPEEYLYHVTPAENAPAIAKEGLRIDAPKIAEGGPHGETKAVFLADHGTVDTYRDLYGAGDTPITVYRVPRSALGSLEGDAASEGSAFLSRQNIPAAALERETGAGWSPVVSPAGAANPGAIFDAYARIMGKAADTIGEMESRPSLFDPYYPAKLRTILEDLAKDSGKAADPVTAFQHLTRLRQEIGDKISWGRAALLPPAERDAQQLMKGMYREISDTLRSEEVFGAAGARKAELDEAFAAWKRIVERRPGAMLGKSEKGTSNFNFLMMQSGALSPNKMNQWFKHLADDTGALKTEAWSQMMDTARRAADAVESLHQAAPVTTFDRAAVGELIDRTGQIAADAREKFAATQVMDQLNPKLARSMHEALGAAQAGQAATQTIGVAQQAAGLLGHGPVSSTIKAVLSPISTAVDTARSFPKGVAVLASLERVGQRVSRAIDAAASTLVRGGARAESIGRAEVVAGIAREFGASAEDATKRFTRRVAEIQRLSQDPEAMHRALIAQNEGLDQHAPNTSQALSVASARAVAFLAAKIPQNPMRGPLAPKWEPSQTEIAKFSRYYEAVKDPLVVLKQAAAGTLTPEAAEAVRTVYPDLWAKKIQAAIMEKLATPGIEVPSRNRLALSMLLDQDLDGRLGMLAALQAVHAAPSRQQAGQLRPTATGMGEVGVADRTLTPMQRSAQRRG